MCILEKEERYKISDLTIHFGNLERRKIKCKQKKAIIKIRVEINKTENEINRKKKLVI